MSDHPGLALAPGAAGDLRVNGSRLLGRLDDLAAIGGSRDGGVTRMGFSPEDRQARAYVVQEATAAGLRTRIDAGGNLLIRRPSGHRGVERPAVLVGSHLDTVAQGGRLDGAYGVIAALEVLQTLHEGGVATGCEIIAIAFANEEGALFPQPFWGSMVLTGQLDALPSEPQDSSGKPLRQALELAGGDMARLATAVWPPGSCTAYLELHVEQGPVLQRRGRRIGVVDSITGRTLLRVQMQGRAGHAGTTPMGGRQDPLVVAAQAVLAVKALAGAEQLCRVATVGWMDVRPNSPNTVPDVVRLDVDLRDSDHGRLAEAEEALRRKLALLARRGDVQISVEAAVRTDPVPTDPRLRHAIEASAAELGLAHETLASGAGHDAQIMAAITPVGMIFVPSIDGVSHVPSERTAPEDLVAGAEVLLRTVLRV
ncbi:Zn-dependent hydrolase [Streptomyces sp. NRRL S-474]|uniref:Zn-dependent hydrolase n=1 Tax=Streptomyces sp. NRRL S-474 TaxID=1463909 RepID=UPI000691B535|nr:Zn-dependent hydrolase [Streptomyces sp. NRRL S-474]